MKKLLILAGVLAISISTQSIAAENISPNNPPKPPCNCAQAKRPDKPPFDKEKFEKRLKLTDAQKEQARVIREKGHEQMKPIMEKIKEKHEEINAIRLTKLTQQMKDEQINQLRKELRELKRQANTIRTQNMREFEAILTTKQLKELNKMKEEGRKAFEKAHKKQLLRMPPMEPEFGEPKPPIK